jgi:16S rRNA (guanine527-N7)-methyltransferase
MPSLGESGAATEETLARLRRYSAMLISWNRSFSNLISKNDEPRLVTRHLLESVQPARWMMDSGAQRWVDLGSGGGFPAIPLILAGVGGAWTLVESRRTKALFLRRVIQDLGLDSVEVMNTRFETLAGEADAPVYEGFISRATLPLAPTLALAARVVARGGSAFLWKGSGYEQELETAPGWSESWRLDGARGLGSGPTSVVRFIRK